MTVKEVREKLNGIVDTVSHKNGVFTVRREFFYTHGRTAASLAAAITKLIPGAVITDSGEVWKPFRGGASTANSSHWYVKFTITPKEEPCTSNPSAT